MDPTSEPPLKKRKIDQNTAEAVDPANNMETKYNEHGHPHRTGRVPTFLNESIVAYYKVNQNKILKIRKNLIMRILILLCSKYYNFAPGINYGNRNSA